MIGGSGHRATFLRYLAAGAMAAAANYGSRFVFSWWLPFEAAVVLAHGVGIATAFVLMRHFAFQASATPWREQIGMFLVVSLASMLQTLVVSSVLARWALPALGVAAHREAIAHAVGVAVPMVTSYFGHRKGSFKP